MKSVIVGLAFCLFFCGCAVIDPQISKAITEKEQLEESKKQTELLQQEVEQLKRIAAALEKMAFN